MLESWRWLHSLHSTVNNRQVDWTQLDHVIDAAVAALPQLAGIKDAAPDATFRIRGQKLAREPHRYSGRTAMRANISVHEPRQPQDKDTMFAFSMEGNNQPSAPRSQIPFARAPGWNSPQAWNKFGMKWAVNCATAIRACVCLKLPLAVLSTLPQYRQASGRGREMAYRALLSPVRQRRAVAAFSDIPEPHAAAVR